MGGVLEGFATIAVVIGVGALLAHLGILDMNSRLVLSRVAFFVANPALMVTVLGDTDIGAVLSRNLVASLVSVIVTASCYLVAARLWWRRNLADTVIGTWCSCYVNAGNLGLPVAAYALGNAAYVAPTLLLQLLVLQPAGLALLDFATSERRASLGRIIRRPLTNPMTVGSLLGLALSISGARLPLVVGAPLHLVGAMAVPSMLMAYGISLRLGPRPGHGGSSGEIAFVTVLKLVVQPLTAFATGRVIGLSGVALLAVTVIAALPTAQNIYVYATRYARGEVVSRDVIFATTVVSVPVIVTLAALLA